VLLPGRTREQAFKIGWVALFAGCYEGGGFNPDPVSCQLRACCVFCGLINRQLAWKWRLIADCYLAFFTTSPQCAQTALHPHPNRILATHATPLPLHPSTQQRDRRSRHSRQPAARHAARRQGLPPLHLAGASVLPAASCVLCAVVRAVLCCPVFLWDSWCSSTWFH